MSRKVTLRLSDEDFGKLQSRCQDTGLDISFIIREALSSHLSGAAPADQGGNPDSTNHAMPPEAFALAGPYRAFSGDLRAELRKQLKVLLALAHSTADQYPRTKGVREAYLAILNAYHQLNGVGHA
jgi:hypothetical protein